MQSWVPPKVLIHSTVRLTLMAELVDNVKRHQVGLMVGTERERESVGGGGG